MADLPDPVEYEGASGGWGSLKGISRIELKERAGPGAMDTLKDQNKPGGTMCPSCAWVKPPNPHAFEFCENGAKATLWDLTSRRCGPEFFARHTVSELRGWDGYELEMQGRLTHPLRYDAASDHYVETSWDEAFTAIGAQLRALEPKATTFYASGKAGLERVVSVRPVRADVRAQQPARQLQHVPRDHLGGAEEGDRFAGGHLHAR